MIPETGISMQLVLQEYTSGESSPYLQGLHSEYPKWTKGEGRNARFIKMLPKDLGCKTSLHVWPLRILTIISVPFAKMEIKLKPNQNKQPKLKIKTKTPNPKPQRKRIGISRFDIYKAFRICKAIYVVHYILKYMEGEQSYHITVLKKRKLFCRTEKNPEIYTCKDQNKRWMQ